MLRDQHVYSITTTWIGNRGSGTSGYRDYGRDHDIEGAGKDTIVRGSSTPVYRGDRTRYNPEELLIGSLSACHMLWLLHLCAAGGIVVTAYRDEASGTMHLNPDGSGEFKDVVLRPVVRIADASRTEELPDLHHRAHELCFIARSVNFPVRCEPRTET